MRDQKNKVARVKEILQQKHGHRKYRIRGICANWWRLTTCCGCGNTLTRETGRLFSARWNLREDEFVTILWGEMREQHGQVAICEDLDACRLREAVRDA